MSRWEIEGDFSRILVEFGGGEQSQRDIHFKNPAECPIILNIHLYRNWSGNFGFSIISADGHSPADRLRTAITSREEIPLGVHSWFYSYSACYVSPRSRTIETEAWFQPLMDVINELEPTFASTQTEIIQLINQYQNAPVRQEARRLTFFNDWMMADDNSSLGDFIEDTNISSLTVQGDCLFLYGIVS